MEYVAIGIAGFVGGIVCGFAGFAFSAAAGAILLHFLEPILAIPLMMVCSIASQLTSLVVLRRFVAWREIVPMLIGGTAGVPVALYLLTLIELHTFRTGFGVFLIGYASYMLTRPACAVINNLGGPIFRSALGFAGGFVGGLTAMPGALPTIWCDLRGLPKERQRGVVQPFILGMQLLALAILMGTPGAIHLDLLLKDVSLALPALAAGTFIGMSLFGRINERKFRCSILVLLLISGGLMLG